MRWIVLAIILCVAVIEIDSFRIYRRPFIRRRWPIGRHYGGSDVGSKYARGRRYHNTAYDNGARGAEGGNYHNAGTHEFHNIGQHHNKYTKIEKSENSGSHNIGGSDSYDNGGAFGRNFANHNTGLNQYGSDYDQGQDHATTW
ncbi:unnamed protein product [Leptosia nina]|uniref:Uncharacterized protein n=1 Tax=Leptosia nina TaxID=320188 RepID=A0AAV1JEE6_9NEOP